MKRTNTMKSDKGRILILEDEKLIIDMYQMYFEQHDYDFLSSANVQEALDLARFEQPDVILLDIIIPKVEDGIVDITAEQGYDFLAAAKRDKDIKNIPVIVFTNLDTIEDRVKSADLGAIAYLCKKSSAPEDVLQMVAAVIANEKNKRNKGSSG